jgi:hypothetical protein
LTLSLEHYLCFTEEKDSEFQGLLFSKASVICVFSPATIKIIDVTYCLSSRKPSKPLLINYILSFFRNLVFFVNTAEIGEGCNKIYVVFLPIATEVQSNLVNRYFKLFGVQKTSICLCHFMWLLCLCLLIRAIVYKISKTANG